MMMTDDRDAASDDERNSCRKQAGALSGITARTLLLFADKFRRDHAIAYFKRKYSTVYAANNWISKPICIANELLLFG